jgi:hypothetical protein
MIETRLCLNCKKKIPKKRLNYKRVIYCSRHCQEEHYRDNMYNRRLTGLNTANRGAISELIASSKLLKMGYHVFRSLSSSCPCDLIVIDPDENIYKIEVKTGVLSFKNKKLKYSKPSNDYYDILLVVLDNGKVIFKYKIPPDTQRSV